MNRSRKLKKAERALAKAEKAAVRAAQVVAKANKKRERILARERLRHDAEVARKAKKRAAKQGSTKQESGGCKNAITTIGTFEFTRLLHKQLGGGRDMPFDMWAQHLYPVGPPDRAAFFPSWRSLPGLTKLLNKMHPTNRMPLIISETGYTTSYSPYHRYFASEAQQAKWVDLTYKVAAQNAQVELVVWFNMQDHRNWPAGLFRADLSKKPSFSRFRALATRTPLSAKWALP